MAIISKKLGIIEPYRRPAPTNRLPKVIQMIFQGYEYLFGTIAFILKRDAPHQAGGLVLLVPSGSHHVKTHLIMKDIVTAPDDV
ncbi:hypothetical protein A7U60_g6620 [Sanghuangporus baumii]|uniref:Uncharacterized protein n=1 Tax=Sanghuangporus baumii TaxID=108892 RepID=A0A9Q5HUM9_SANBA|nr:hypothetical protein A7U60_g6620 [Sanghuangporus baumii]